MRPSFSGDITENSPVACAIRNTNAPVSLLSGSFLVFSCGICDLQLTIAFVLRPSVPKLYAYYLATTPFETPYPWALDDVEVSTVFTKVILDVLEDAPCILRIKRLLTSRG